MFTTECMGLFVDQGLITSLDKEIAAKMLIYLLSGINVRFMNTNDDQYIKEIIPSEKNSFCGCGIFLQVEANSPVPIVSVLPFMVTSSIIMEFLVQMELHQLPVDWNTNNLMGRLRN